MDPAELERLIDHRLRQLPVPRAPDTLVPRVMQAVQQRSLRPWYTRAWFTWPVGWRLASIGAFAVAIVAGLVLAPTPHNLMAGLVARASKGTLDQFSPIAQQIELIYTVAHVLWRALVQPIIPYALGLAMLMYIACALAGTALTYLVWERR